jgi:hypothetical protein
LDRVGVHDGGDTFPDAGEGNLSGAEGLDGDFVGGVVNGGQGAAGETGAAGEIERREIRAARGFEFQFRERGEIERAEAAFDAPRPGERVLDGKAHVGPAELGEHRAVGELDHRVDDALRVDDHVDALHADAEQPAGLDHFEAFVEKGGGVDGDFRPHFPGRVLEGLGEGDVADLIGRQGPERAAGCG